MEPPREPSTFQSPFVSSFSSSSSHSRSDGKSKKQPSLADRVARIASAYIQQEVISSTETDLRTLEHYRRVLYDASHPTMQLVEEMGRASGVAGGFNSPIFVREMIQKMKTEENARRFERSQTRVPATPPAKGPAKPRSM